MNCPNLRELYGDRYRVATEESRPAKGEGSQTADPWLLVIPCQNGHICPWGSDLLAACTNGRGSIAKRLTELPFVTVEQDGSDGVNASFHVDRIEEVAQIMRPKRKRPPRTEAQRRATERLGKYQFQPGKRDTHSTLESRVDPQRVSEHQEALSNGF